MLIIQFEVEIKFKLKQNFSMRLISSALIMN